MEKVPEVRDDPYVNRFLYSPVYVMVMRQTIDTATRSYQVARWLSVVSFIVGIALIGIAVLFSFTRNEEALSLIFGGLGTANLIALLVYRPMERIQSGVDKLIKSQIACLSFQAQYDSIARTLATMSALPLKDTDRDEQLKLAQYLKESTSQIIADLGGHGPVSSPP